MADSTSMVTIPVVDISNLDIETGRELVDASEKYGFVFIKNLEKDIPTSSVDGAFNISKNFFAIPAEEKAKFPITANNMGWSSPGSEILDHKSEKAGEFKEAFNMGEFQSGKAQQPLPEILSSVEPTLSKFDTLCHDLCLRILELFAIGLEIPDSAGGKSWFSSRHDRSKGKSGTIFRLLFYPYITASAPGEQPVDEVRAGAHSDYGSITLLFQRPGQAGLEIQTVDGSWAKVPVLPAGTENDAGPPILVNIGDLLSYWTGGLLKSTVHRVLMPEGEAGNDTGERGRYSIAYFCHPLNGEELVAVPSERVKSRGVKGANVITNGKALTAAEHLKNRLAETYGWKEDEEK